MEQDERPAWRFQFTIRDLLLISLACVLWVAVFARYGPAYKDFDDQFLYPDGRRTGNCVFFIVGTVVAGFIVLAWAAVTGASRSRQTGCLKVTLLVILPLCYIGFFILRGRVSTHTHAENVRLQLVRLQMSQSRYWGQYGEYSPTLGALDLSFDMAGIEQADGLPGDPGVKPYYGYVYRVLKAQGAHAPGGRKSFVTIAPDGMERMTNGFTIIAIPVGGEKGIVLMTVRADVPTNLYRGDALVGKAFGPDAAKIARWITEYDPDESWIMVGR